MKESIVDEEIITQLKKSIDETIDKERQKLKCVKNLEHTGRPEQPDEAIKRSEEEMRELFNEIKVKLRTLRRSLING